MEILKVIGALLCCSLVFVAGTIVWRLFEEWGMRELRREYEYYKKYKEIQDIVCDWPVTLINHDAIFILLNELKKLKHKDRKKTNDLTNRFYWHYRSLAKHRAHCETSVEAAFKN